MTIFSGYEHYQKLKGWDVAPFMLPSPAEIMFYEHYLGKIRMVGAKVLEIGFGNGNFIGWAKQRGAQVYGTEVQSSAVEKAKERGVTVLPIDIASSAGGMCGNFTIIAALDVMEHLTIEQNISLLTSAAAMLESNGVLFLRFPNGQSPLSLAAQYGDVSHVSTLSIDIINQLIIDLPLFPIYAGAPYRPLTGGIPSRIVSHLQAALRYGADRLIRLLYGEIPMYMNAVMLLRKV